MMDQLRELLARRRQLVVMINAEKQRLARAEGLLTRRSHKPMLRSLEGERDRVHRDRVPKASSPSAPGSGMPRRRNK